MLRVFAIAQDRLEAELGDGEHRQDQTYDKQFPNAERRRTRPVPFAAEEQ
jgi:hypothetical protein